MRRQLAAGGQIASEKHTERLTLTDGHILRIFSKWTTRGFGQII
jgi:hypothetical protein